MNNQEFKAMLEQKPHLKEDLFIRGFLITTNDAVDLREFPFYGNWREERHGNFRFCAHKLTGMHFYQDAMGRVFFVMGHAYDPFTMEWEEEKVLVHIAEGYGTEAYQDRINEITGVFVIGCLDENGVLEYQVDASGMQSACWGQVADSFYLSSHPQIIGDICNLQMAEIVRELVNYKWYSRVMGPYLPADLTPFAELKRIVPSISYRYDGTKITHRRFWPLADQSTATDPSDYQQVIEQAAAILQNSMALVPKKWKHPWISLTGGVGSGTAVAAANGNHDKYETFSYISAEKEICDAAAACVIAEEFGIAHHEYYVPATSEGLADYEEIVEIQRHNSGYIAERKANESRKRVYLQKNAGCDVELKSWVSETARAYYYKHFNRKELPPLSAKLYRNLYKIFLADRNLAHKVDKLYEQYLVDYEYWKIPGCYPPSDVFLTECMGGCWGGINISEMKLCFDITIVYNNRKYLDVLFRVPLDKRISDEHYMDMRRLMNPRFADMDVRVTNSSETNFRACGLNFIFVLNAVLP